MKTDFLSQLLVEISKLNQKYKSCTFSLSDLRSYPTEKIDCLVKENEIIITNFLPDEINKPINIETHKSLCEKLFFCPLNDHVSTDLKTDLSENKTVIVYEKSSLLLKENPTFDLIIRSLSNNDNFDIIFIDESDSLDNTLVNILKYKQIFICVKDIALSTQIYITSLAYKKSIKFLTKPYFSPFRCLLLGLPFPNVVNYDKKKSLRFFVNQIINMGESSSHLIDTKNINFEPFTNPQRLMTLNQSESYKAAYKSIYLEDDSKLQYLWCSLTDKKLLTHTVSPIDFANNKFFRKSSFNFLDSNLEESSFDKEITNNVICYLLTPTECLTTKKNIADIIVKYPHLLKNLCSPLSELEINEADLTRRNVVSACVDFSYKFSEHKVERKDLLQSWTTMIALDKKEGLAPSKAKLYEYVLPTVLSMKENSPDAILQHLEKLSTPNIAKLLAVHARWSEESVFDEVMSSASTQNNARINLKQSVLDKLLTPFVTCFFSSPGIFEEESEKWISTLLNNLEYSRFNPRTSFLFIMNQILKKKDLKKIMIPLTEKLISSPYAIPTICHGLWWYGLKEELQILKTSYYEFFSSKFDTLNIHSKLPLILSGVIEDTKEFVDILAKEPSPLAISDNFYKFFNLGIFYRQKDNDLKSERFFEIAKELNPQTYSNIFPKIPNS
ncbi:MAG: hypothetical protein CMI19_02365 [Opitutae bacterium]|nr:hypothetical protein [Opitutae bacterium]|tara:strand:+ start:10071 stop:12080 length:2010 start_codon:yes stop_codon:yes gene_type:complete